MARGLGTLADITATRYFQHTPQGLRDPVLSAQGDRLRAECFSADNGVYARLDLLEAGFDGGDIGFGTTNVDVGMELRQALATVTRDQLLHIDVGVQGLTASSPDKTAHEHPVSMPDRWVRALGNAAESQRDMQPVLTLDAAQARAFVASLPAATGKYQAGWVTVAPSGVKMAARRRSGAAFVPGLHRLSALKRVLTNLDGLTFYQAADAGDAASPVLVEASLLAARLTLGLTAESWRGFSGEGSLLTSLAGPTVAEDADAVRSCLVFEPVIDVARVAKQAGISPDRAMELPLGTAEQRRIAVAGLRSGVWGEYVWEKHADGGSSASYRSLTGVDHGLLSIFAIRVGIDSAAAVKVAYHCHNLPDGLLIAALEARGPAFAAGFVQHACVRQRRALEHAASVFGVEALRLVADLDLPIPQNVEYMKDWAAVAAAALNLPAEIGYSRGKPPDQAMIEARFTEHVRAGVAVGAPATGPFGSVLPAGVAKGWLGRGEAVELVFAALDAAVRPGDRQVWLGALDELDATDAEFLSRADALVPLLATGEAPVVERLSPLLISRADDATAVEVLTASLTTPTKKALRVVLEAALDRPSLAGAEDLGPQLAVLAASKDKRVATLAARLIDHWAVGAPPASRPAAEPETRGLWQPTPALWAVPRFGHGSETPEALTDLAAELVRRPDGAVDVVTERFLAVANAVAYHDPSAARRALQGVGKRSAPAGLRPVPSWVAGQPPNWGLDVADHIEPILTAREFAVFQHLGEMSCLLSEPSFDDLTVSLPDLVARLELYQATGAVCVEADLLLALMRLDPATAAPTLAARLAELAVPVVLQSGARMDIGAGSVVSAYLGDPVLEPALVVNARWRSMWDTEPVVWPESLSAFPDRLDRYASHWYAVFPHWSDAGLLGVRWSPDVEREQGLVLRQVARRATPLPPGAAVNLLAAQRSMPPVAAEDSARAVAEAWQRGLLRPGVADVRYLDWSTQPGNLAALATALGEIAQTGPLSVVWPVMDDLVAASLTAPRLLAGTAEILDAIAEYLPEVLAAVTDGRAEQTALELSAVRALANRPGNARAVETARHIVAQLPSQVPGSG